MITKVKRFRPVVVMFHSRIMNQYGVWENAQISTAGYEDTQAQYDPAYLVLREKIHGERALAIARKNLMGVTYFDD